jgi:hypothetical protein
MFVRLHTPYSILLPYLLYRLVTHFIPLSLRHGSLPVCTVPYEYRPTQRRRRLALHGVIDTFSSCHFARLSL